MSRQEKLIEFLNQEMSTKIYKEVHKATIHLQGSSLQDAAVSGSESVKITSNLQIEPLIEQIEKKMKQKLQAKSNKTDLEMLMKQIHIISKQIKEVVQLMMQKFKLSIESQAGESKNQKMK